MAEPQHVEAPPAGEEIHLPEPTLMPVVLAFGITLSLLGTTITWIFSAIGVPIVLITIVRWIRIARRDLRALPPEHR